MINVVSRSAEWQGRQNNMFKALQHLPIERFEAKISIEMYMYILAGIDYEWQLLMKM